jgi:thioredoxin-related protein
MKKIYFFLLALPLLCLMSFVNFNELPIGSSLPKATVLMKDISGKEVSLKDAKKANGLLVMFSCNTCPYVIKNQPRTKELASFAQENNIGIILINSNEGQRADEDSFEAMKQYAKQQGYSWYYVVDKNSEIADAFGANRTPECFLFNKEDKLVYHGAIDDNPGNPNEVGRKHLKEAISEMLSNKEVTIKTSRSVGCGIKRKP